MSEDVTNKVRMNDRRKHFIKVYGREPTPEELRVFVEYIELVKRERCR